MRLRFQKRALQQIETALASIAAESPKGAANVEKRLRVTLARLQQHPKSGSRTPIPGVRRANLTPYPYHVDYFVSRDEIVVQRFRHSARKPLSTDRPS